MLVLSRKQNESIVINNDITLTVVEVRGDKVRLGIVAPKEVPVHRQEVYEAIHGIAPVARADGGLGEVFRLRPDEPVYVELTLDQLAQELGPSQAEGKRTIRFTTEGGISRQKPSLP
jgi:carbon storage regulator